MKINIAVMAGGQSRRFKSDKTLELFDGKPLISHPVDRLRGIADEIIVVAKDCGKYNFLNITCIKDGYDVQCPMVGILTALKYFQAPVFTIAADVPFPEPSHVRRLFSSLDEADAAVPLIDGSLHPLYACYSPGVLETFEQAVSDGEFSLIKALKRCRVFYPENTGLFDSENEKKSFININTREEYETAKKYTGDSDG